MSAIDLIIDVRDGSNPDLVSYVADRGAHARPHYGTFAGPMPEIAEMLKHPAPYVLITGTAVVLREIIKGYTELKKKRLIVHRLKTGIKIDATNYSVEELKDLGVLDIGEFSDTKSAQPLGPANGG